MLQAFLISFLDQQRKISELEINMAAGEKSKSTRSETIRLHGLSPVFFSSGWCLPSFSFL
jgi:hypothetical protein